MNKNYPEHPDALAGYGYGKGLVDDERWSPLGSIADDYGLDDPMVALLLEDAALQQPSTATVAEQQTRAQTSG